MECDLYQKITTFASPQNSTVRRQHRQLAELVAQRTFSLLYFNTATLVIAQGCELPWGTNLCEHNCAASWHRTLHSCSSPSLRTVYISLPGGRTYPVGFRETASPATTSCLKTVCVFLACSNVYCVHCSNWIPLPCPMFPGIQDFMLGMEEKLNQRDETFPKTIATKQDAAS